VKFLSNRAFPFGMALLAPLAANIAGAQDSAPANTLMDIRHQFGGCLRRTPVGSNGSRVTIIFSLKRDGSIFGKPRITFSHVEGGEEAGKRFLEDAERAVDSCLPIKVTPALGDAIAGHQFFITLGGPKPEKAI